MLVLQVVLCFVQMPGESWKFFEPLLETLDFSPCVIYDANKGNTSSDKIDNHSMVMCKDKNGLTIHLFINSPSLLKVAF